MIKNTIKVLAAACVALISIVSFTACSNDDDNDNKPSKKEATEATVMAEVYTTAFTLKYFKVEATDASGNTVELTTQNTTEAAAFPKVYKMTADLNPSANGDKLLKYSFGKETFKSFPKSMTYTATITARDQKPADGEKIIVTAVPVLTLANNAAGGSAWSVSNQQLSLNLTTISASSWDKYVASFPRKVNTVDLTFNSASAYEISGLHTSK